ncbi:hypothetical protein CMV30_15625 [Nibricoccus aquaticus]|uniref:Uncharacterized protein n=1 Tax=Nibricoccus aquaticus TaxID=2576891 RepID=A0A290Q9R5_9BACT|nr:hypothetical protein [Nibricoccus aquaticus]ATC65264.1 hypothetical protein CMV30_15625 [Nibricoccus aquaticus]
MENKTVSWQKRFGFTVCAADAVEKKIPAKALGVAVIFEPTETGEKIFLVIESRASGLRAHCVKRLTTGKLPPVASLKVAFKAVELADASPESVKAACREQLILTGELRRELRPAMR